MNKKLSHREKEVLELVSMGHSSKDIAIKLGIGTRTVDSHRQGILTKYGVKNSEHAVRVAIECGDLPINIQSAVVVTKDHNGFVEELYDMLSKYK